MSVTCDEVTRIYTIFVDGEELTKAGSIEDVLDTVHTALGEMMSDVNTRLSLKIEVGPGHEDEV